MNYMMLVLDIGGTSVKYALADASGSLLPGSVCQRPANADGTFEDFLALLNSILLEARREGPVLQAAVSIPGPFDYAAGVSRMRHKFSALFGRSLRPPFEDAGVPVSFLHDSTAFLLGAAQDTDPEDCCGVMLGTGLGFAWMRNRHILVDPGQTPVLTLWNRPFRQGIAEDYVSTRALLASVPELRNVRDLADAARAGDFRAVQAFRSVGQALSDLLNPLLPVLGVRAVLFGGQISRSMDLFDLSLSLPWRVCSHPEETALLGAARYALQGSAHCVTVAPPIPPGGFPSPATAD